MPGAPALSWRPNSCLRVPYAALCLTALATSATASSCFLGQPQPAAAWRPARSPLFKTAVPPGPTAQSQVDVTFWSELSEQKLNVFKLSEQPVPLTGASRRGGKW